VEFIYTSWASENHPTHSVFLNRAAATPPLCDRPCILPAQNLPAAPCQILAVRAETGRKILGDWHGQVHALFLSLTRLAASSANYLLRVSQRAGVWRRAVMAPSRTTSITGCSTSSGRPASITAKRIGPGGISTGTLKRIVVLVCFRI